MQIGVEAEFELNCRLDLEKLTFKHQGRRYRLTDVAGKVVNGLIA